MKFLLVVLSVMVLLAPAGLTSAADDSKVKAATQQVETGAKKIGDGQVGTGVEADGQGHRQHGRRGREVHRREAQGVGQGGRAQAKSSWTSFKESANSFGHSVKNFFTTLFD